ncbi:MAG: type II secretion system protein GspN [Nitrospira sp.]|nr:type II secretion system protein GspN [Nitrospira sp.]
MMTIKWPGEWRATVAWVGGGVCLLILCLAATFPYEALHKRIVAELNRATGMDIRVGNWTIGLPLGIEWRNVTLAKSDWAPIQLASLQADVGIMQVLSGGLGLDVVIHLGDTSPGGGLAKGTVTASSYSLAKPVSVVGRFQQVDLSKIVRPYVGHGILNGTFSHRIESAQAVGGTIKGEGTWKAEATDLTIDHIPVGNGHTLSLTFSQASAELVCKDSLCEITELNGEGPDGSFTGNGGITVQQPIQDSRLALTVTVIPGEGYASKANTLGLLPLPPGTPITVKIAGTLAQARISPAQATRQKRIRWAYSPFPREPRSQ